MLLSPFSLQLENRESRWEDAVSTLNSKVPFTVTSDIKRLLRLGIPISQRVSIWQPQLERSLFQPTQTSSKVIGMMHLDCALEINTREITF